MNFLVGPFTVYGMDLKLCMENDHCFLPKFLGSNIGFPLLSLFSGRVLIMHGAAQTTNPKKIVQPLAQCIVIFPYENLLDLNT